MTADPVSLGLLTLLAVAFGLLVFVAVPRAMLLAGLIILSSFAPLGSGTTGALLPSFVLLSAVAVFIILMGFTSFGDIRSTRMRNGVISALFAVLFWTAIAYINFQFDLDLVGRTIQYVSYIGTFLVAYHLAQDVGRRWSQFLGWMTIIPAVFLIAGRIAGWAATVNDSGRAYGAFPHANAAAAYFVIGTIACLWCFRSDGRKVNLLAVVIGVVALLFTQSVGGSVGLAAGLILLVLLDDRRPIGERLSLVAVSSCVMGAFFAVLAMASGRLSQYYGSDIPGAIATGKTSGNSAEWRAINWNLLLTEWWNSPSRWTGYGLGVTYSKVQPLGLPPHSAPIEVLVELGIIGSAVAISFMAILGTAIWKRYRAKRTRISAVALMSVTAAVIVNSSESNWLGYSAAVYLALFIVGCLLGQSGSGMASARDHGESIDAVQSIAPSPKDADWDGRRVRENCRIYD